VVLFHGLRGNRGRTLERIAFLVKAGYRCIAFDHRAHGQSQGRFTSFGYHESRDVEAIADLVRDHWPDEPCAALGISMGAAALCFAAGQWDALILESLYTDLASAFRTRVGHAYPVWFQRFRRGVIWITERRLGLRLDELAPSRHMHSLAPAPLLLLTGSEDPHASPASAAELFQRCQDPRELVFIPGAGHLDVCEKGGIFYQQLVLDFLDRKMPRS
jgi:pimeloyl-ACP methyl ester carboxylesterase